MVNSTPFLLAWGIIKRIYKFFMPKRGINYWKIRAKRYGARSVFNISHSESEMAEVTEMQIREIFPHFLSQLNGTEQVLLDYGCGPGRFSIKLAETIHGKVIGVDPIKKLLELAPPLPKNDIIYKRIIHDRIPLDNNTVDAVWCCLVLGAVLPSKLQKAVNEICRVLKPGGLFFLIENTDEKTNDSSSSWIYRSIKEYQALFPLINLKHIHDYYDKEERISIFAGRIKEN